jgi:uncharacterized membrane protein YhaH (DUF805 family)
MTLLNDQDQLDGAADSSDLTRPLYGASFGQAVSRFFKKSAGFSGRASRSEYWWVALFGALLGLAPAALFGIGTTLSIAWADQNPIRTVIGTDEAGNEVVFESQPGILNAPTAWLIWVGLVLLLLIGLALLVPQLALTWRRLHDANLPGAFYFLSLIPSVGTIIVLVMTLLPSKPEGRRFDA